MIAAIESYKKKRKMTLSHKKKQINRNLTFMSKLNNNKTLTFGKNLDNMKRRNCPRYHDYL